MKRIGWFIIFLAAAIAVMVQINSNPKIIIAGLLKNGSIQPGNLKFRINFLGILPIGDALLTAKKEEKIQGIKTYHLSAYTESLKFYAPIFTGSARVDSYIDPQTLNPILFRQKAILKNKEAANKEVVYDQKAATMTINGKTYQTLPDTRDPLAAIYNLRKIDFNRVKDFEMNINTNQKNYLLKGTAKNLDLSINKKIFPLVLVKAQISRRDKNPYHKSSITMLLFKGEENIPLYIKVFASGILISSKLIEIK